MCHPYEQDISGFVLALRPWEDVSIKMVSSRLTNQSIFVNIAGFTSTSFTVQSLSLRDVPMGSGAMVVVYWQEIVEAAICSSKSVNVFL
jgi:hypothetical protein